MDETVSLPVFGVVDQVPDPSQVHVFANALSDVKRHELFLQRSLCGMYIRPCETAGECDLGSCSECNEISRRNS